MPMHSAQPHSELSTQCRHCGKRIFATSIGGYAHSDSGMVAGYDWTFADLANKAIDGNLLPGVEFGQDNQGQLIIHTGLRIKSIIGGEEVLAPFDPDEN